uniref:Uncharacterized protein n=1 Tax=Chrysotila carterae TaxID=13221 RepID=A0A7S4F363_CHRCT
MAAKERLVKFHSMSSGSSCPLSTYVTMFMWCTAPVSMTSYSMSWSSGTEARYLPRRENGGALMRRRSPTHMPTALSSMAWQTTPLPILKLRLPLPHTVESSKRAT